MNVTLAETAAGTFAGTYIVDAIGTSTIYVVCRDYAGNPGTGNTGAFTVDNEAPSILTITPTISSGWQATATSTVTLTTDVTATCRYDDNEAADYASMDNLFTGGGGTTHTVDINNIEGTNYYYVLCQNTNGMTMPEALPISWKADINNPITPVREYPLDGDLYLANSLLNWSASTDGSGSGINYYTLQIDNDNAFGSPEISTNVYTDAYVLTAGDKVTLNEGTNYWQVQAVDNAGRVSGYQGTDWSFVLAETAPIVEEISPVNGATSVSVNVLPVLVFDSQMSNSTLTPANIKLYKYSDDSAVTLDANGGIISESYIGEDGDLKTYVIIIPAAALSYSTQYYITISANVLDTSGNAFVAWTAATKADHDFTTADIQTGALRANVSQTRFYGTADGTYANGWEWVISATIPTDELDVSLKFADWTGIGGTSIAVANNMRYYCEQSATNTATTTAITITTANSYADGPMTITAANDLDASTDGIQVEIVVQIKIPVNTSAGAYSTRYGILSE